MENHTHPEYFASMPIFFFNVSIANAKVVGLKLEQIGQTSFRWEALVWKPHIVKWVIVSFLLLTLVYHLCT